MITCSGGRSAS